MQRRTYAAIAGMILTMMLTGCGNPSNPTPVPATLRSITVTPSSSSIAPLTTMQFTARGVYSNGGTQNLTSSVTWSSSDTGIAVISAGLATAGSSTGSTVITAVYSGITGSTLLTTSDVVSLALSPSAPKTLAPGMKQQFAATGTLANSVTQILTSLANWASSNETIATVSNVVGSKGLATAVAAPNTMIISATFSGVTGSVTLATSPVNTISTSPSAASIANGTTQQFTASGTLDDSTQHDLTSLATWSSSNTTVATINNAGLAFSHSTGTTFIIATFNSVTSSPTSTLVVTPVILTSIAISPTNTSLALGVDQQYIAIGTFSDLSTKNVTTSTTWHSSDQAVATISTTGFATSLSEGTTDIIASTPSVTSNTAKLIITQAVLVSIAVTPTSANAVFPAATKQFTAMGTYTDGTVLDLTNTATWVHADSVSIITSVSNGLATVLQWGTGGTSNITAELSGITSNTATLTVGF